MPRDSINTLVVGGEGAVGSLFCALARDSFEGDVASLDVKANHSERLADIQYHIGDIASEQAAPLLTAAELVVLALPADVASNAIVELSPRLRSSQCLVDTLSVKLEYVSKLLELQPAHEALSLNPMFAPALGFRGRSVASVVVREGPTGSALVVAMKAAGATVVEVSAEGHDRQTAAIQAATHAAVLAFAMALQALGYRPSEAAALWAPPHTTLLALVARIVSGEPEVYRDIQVGNPFAEAARAALGQACAELDQLVKTNDPAAFAELFQSLSGSLGTQQAGLGVQCRKLFEGLHKSSEARDLSTPSQRALR
jgi:prephenate dehydrogenase